MSEKNNITKLELIKQQPVYTAKNVTISDDDIDVSLAWLRDEVTLGQIRKALGSHTYSATYANFAINLRQAYRQGKIVIK